MIKQLKIYDSPLLAIEISDSFKEADYKLVQIWADAKREKGFETANLLIKLDGLKTSESSIKAIFEQLIKLLKNFRQFGRVAIVAQSNSLKKMVQIDNFFMQKLSKGSEERYFDISELEEAFAFVESDLTN